MSKYESKYEELAAQARSSFDDMLTCMDRMRADKDRCVAMLKRCQFTLRSYGLREEDNEMMDELNMLIHWHEERR